MHGHLVSHAVASDQWGNKAFVYLRSTDLRFYKRIQHDVSIPTIPYLDCFSVLHVLKFTAESFHIFISVSSRCLTSLINKRRIQDATFNFIATKCPCSLELPCLHKRFFEFWDS